MSGACRFCQAPVTRTVVDLGLSPISNQFRSADRVLRDGQTFAIAGLLNNSMTQTLAKVPGIGDIPILGYLFRSKAARKDQTELVVMITPQILEQGSFGVTNQLPRLQEPYMPRLQENESLPAPPAPFTGTGK